MVVLLGMMVMSRGEQPFVSTRWKKRLSVTGEKVRNVCCIIYMEDLIASGHTYFDLLGYLSSLHMECACSCVHEYDTFTAQDVANWCEQRIDPLTGDLDLDYLGIQKDEEGCAVLDDSGAPVFCDREKGKRVPYVGRHKKPHVHLMIKGPSQQNAQWWSDLFAGLMPIRPSLWERVLSVPGLLRYFAHLDDPDKYQYGIFSVQGFAGFDMSPLIKDDEVRRIELHGIVLAFLQANPNLRYFDDLVNAFVEDLPVTSYIRGTGSYWVAYLSGRGLKLRDKREKKKLEALERTNTE